MILSTIKVKNSESGYVYLRGGYASIENFKSSFHLDIPSDIFSLIVSGKINQLEDWLNSADQSKLKISPPDDEKLSPLYRHPRKIWGIGLNYKKHAADLNEAAPEDEPASFMKPDTTIIGYGDEIKIPLQSNRTTAEAELGIIIGKECRNIERKNWLNYVAGFTPIIDMTAEDILRHNPRFLTRSKSFDTFFSFGPHLYTTNEIEDVMKLEVSTVINGNVHASNVVSNMTFPPDYLVSFHSEVMTLLPGDIISSGTPGAVSVNHRDVVECRITGFKTLRNKVIDLKNNL
ncbi:fumarylacetoacetate hydrolase family protein [Bacteroidota bacterium]